MTAPATNSGSTIVSEADGSRLEIWPLPTGEAFLKELLEYLFRSGWRQIYFGPIIEGAAFEIKPPRAPTLISLADGYLTVCFGETHFHLCIGENRGMPGRPTPAALKKRRRCARAEFFRGLDRRGAPVHWGLRLFNGAGEPQLSVFLPNPFLDDALRPVKTADFTRLTLWDDLRKRYLELPPDPADRLASGFSHC